MKKALSLIMLLAILWGTLGGITVTAHEATATEETTKQLSIDYYNLSFRENVCIKYAVFSNLKNADVKLLVWTAPKTEYLYGTQNEILSTVGYSADLGEDYLVFDYTSFKAKQMTDEVYTVAYANVGGTEYYSEVKKYSILKYAYDILGKTATASTDENLKNLMSSMLEYGANAQKYLNYKTDKLATADFYQITLAGGTLTDGTNYGLYLAGEQVTMTAPVTDADGNAFSHWENKNAENVSSEATYTATVGTENQTYTPVYEQSNYSEGLAFTSNGDGTCYVSGIGTCTDTEINIPHVSPTGDSVTSIGASAFYNNAEITSVEIPSTVTSIGYSAFYCCTKLTNVTMGNSVESIGGSSFFFCSEIKSITIPSSVTSIGAYAFRGCTGLTNIEIPNSVTDIDNWAFSDCTGLMSVTMGNAIERIGDGAFENCTGLTSIVIPRSAMDIGHAVFYGCSELTSIDFTGTVAEWQAKTFNAEWNYGMSDYIITCTDGTIAKNGTVSYN